MTQRRRVILLSPDPPPRPTLQALDREGIDLLTVSDVNAGVEQLRFSAWHLCVVCTTDADAVVVRQTVLDEEIGVRVLAPPPLGRLPHDLEHVVSLALAAQPLQSRRGVPLTVGELRVDPASHEAECAGRPLGLNRRQFRLLYLLALHAPEPVRRAELAVQLRSSDGTGGLRNVDSLVCRLRQRLLAATGRSFVVTVPSIGYALDGEAAKTVSGSSPDRYRRSGAPLTTLGEWPQFAPRSAQPLPQSG